MKALHKRCAGLDGHKVEVVACLRLVSKRKVEREVRRFRTATQGLLELREWLERGGCTHVAMEATGVYWKPVWHILEGRFADATFGRWFCVPADASAYLARLGQTARRFGDFDLLYQAGADVHVDDPLRGVLTTEQMIERDRGVPRPAAKIFGGGAARQADRNPWRTIAEGLT